MLRRSTCTLALAALLLTLPVTGLFAQGAHVDMLLCSTAPGGGALALDHDFSDPIGLHQTLCVGGVCLYSSTNPGFDVATADQPERGLYTLRNRTAVTFELVSADPGVSVKIGSAVLNTPGARATLGTTPDVHVHPSWQVAVPPGQAGVSQLRFRLTTTSRFYAPSAIFTLRMHTGPLVPTPTATSAPTATPTPTPTPSLTPTAPPTATPTDSPTPTPTATGTSTPTPENTRSPSPTPTFTATGTAAPAATPSATPSLTPSPRVPTDPKALVCRQAVAREVGRFAVRTHALLAECLLVVSETRGLGRPPEDARAVCGLTAGLRGSLVERIAAARLRAGRSIARRCSRGSGAFPDAVVNALLDAARCRAEELVGATHADAVAHLGVLLGGRCVAAVCLGGPNDGTPCAGAGECSAAARVAAALPCLKMARFE